MPGIGPVEEGDGLEDVLIQEGDEGKGGSLVEPGVEESSKKDGNEAVRGADLMSVVYDGEKTNNSSSMLTQ
jgi:hypothetical protein